MGRTTCKANSLNKGKMSNTSLALALKLSVEAFSRDKVKTASALRFRMWPVYRASANQSTQTQKNKHMSSLDLFVLFRLGWGPSFGKLMCHLALCVCCQFGQRQSAETKLCKSENRTPKTALHLLRKAWNSTLAAPLTHKLCIQSIVEVVTGGRCGRRSWSASTDRLS